MSTLKLCSQTQKSIIFKKSSVLSLVLLFIASCDLSFLRYGKYTNILVAFCELAEMETLCSKQVHCYSR